MAASRFVTLIVGAVLLTASADLLAQHGGGRATRSRPFICVYDCRDPTAGADPTGGDLKRFDELMAVQATPEQSAAFARTQQDVQAAADQLKILRQLLEKGPTASLPVDGVALSHLLSKARTGSQSFLASFSAAQQSGLKDLITKLTNADSDLGKELTAWDEMSKAPGSPENITRATANLDNALTGFQSNQLAVAREMSILSGEEQGLTFHLPQVTTSAEIAGQQVSTPVAAEVIRTSAADGYSLFSLRLVADLSDLQEDITAILRSRLTSSPRCGERVEVRQAMLLPQSAASVALIHLRHERWICPPGMGREGGGELLAAAGDATIEIKLSPSVDSNGDLHLAFEIGHVDADQVFRDSLLTAPPGTTLAERVSNVVLSDMPKGADLKATLPPVAQNAVTMQKAQFQAGGADQLRLVLDGQLRFSDRQTREFAAQLRQQLSAQATSSQ